jgi:hypothetical protein
MVRVMRVTMVFIDVYSENRQTVYITTPARITRNGYGKTMWFYVKRVKWATAMKKDKKPTNFLNAVEVWLWAALLVAVLTVGFYQAGTGATGLLVGVVLVAILFMFYSA